MTKKIKTAVTEESYQEFFAEERQKKIELLNHQLAIANNKIEKLTAAQGVIERPDLTGKEFPLDYKISLMCAARPEFEYHFHRARKNAIGPDKDFSFIALKRSDKTGRFDIQCETWTADIPLLSDILEKYGPGRYRLMLRYYDPDKVVKGGKIKGGFTLSYFDLTLTDPGASQYAAVELSDTLKKTIADVVECVGLLTAQAKDVLSLAVEAAAVIKNNRGKI